MKISILYNQTVKIFADDMREYSVNSAICRSSENYGPKFNCRLNNQGRIIRKGNRYNGAPEFIPQNVKVTETETGKSS